MIEVFPLSPEARSILEKATSASDISDADLKIILGLSADAKIVHKSDDELWSLVQTDRIRSDISGKATPND